MAGVKGLRKLQIGLEGTAGTAVPATAVLRHTGMIQDDRTVVFPEEQVGYLGGVDRQYTSSYLATLETEGEATFEQLGYFFDSGISTAAASVDGAGSGQIREYNFLTTTATTNSTYTIEGGDNEEVEEMEYSFVRELTLSGKYQESWMLSATWNGRQAVVSAFSASTTLPAVEECLFGKTKLYIDATTATIGTTLKSNTLLQAEIKMVTGWIPKFTADGDLFYSFLVNVGDETTIDITFEHETTSKAEKAKWRAGTPAQIRLLCQGSALASAGTTYTYKTLQMDFAGKWEKFEKIDEIDGNDVIKGTFRVRYNSDAALRGHIILVNEVATLP